MPASTLPVALVTGASSGIGAATALALVQAGYRTYATARRPATLLGLAQAGCATLPLDVTDEASMVAAMNAIVATDGPVGVLVNNAGYGLNGPAEELPLAAVRDVFETNVFGLLRMSQLVLPGMRAQRWGRIINIGSIGGTFTAPGAGAYHATKYAVEALSDAMRYEVQRWGIDVVVIQPTGVRTPFVAKLTTTVPPASAASPYAPFNVQLARTVERLFAPGAPGIITPEAVARVVVAAAQAQRPRTRYKVGWSAHVYFWLRRLLGDRAWDALMATQFPVDDRPVRRMG